MNLKQATKKTCTNRRGPKLKWSNATIKTSLKKASGEYRKQWHKYLPVRILIYNRTYHSSVHCDPTQVFRGGVPHNILDHKLLQRFNPNVHLLQTLQLNGPAESKYYMTKSRKMPCSFTINTKNITTKKQELAFKEQKLLFHKSVKSRPPRVKIPFQDSRWIGPYPVGKMLPSTKYNVCKLNTNRTQNLQRFRLRIYNPENPPYTTIRGLNGRLTILVIYLKKIYTPLHGKRKLKDTYFKFPFFILAPTEVILMKVSHSDQRLLLSCAPNFMT